MSLVPGDTVPEGLDGVCRHCGKVVIWVNFNRDSTFATPQFTWMHKGTIPPERVETYGMFRQRTTEQYGDLHTGCLMEIIEGMDPGPAEEAEPREYCTFRTGLGHICNKVVTEKEWFACGIHAARERERVKEQEANRKEREVQASIIEGVNELCIKLKAKFGLEYVEPEKVTYSRSYSGKVVLEPKELMDLLDDFMEDE